VVNIILMTGGKGKRLLPYTEHMNKCLLDVGKGRKLIDFSLNHINELFEKKLIEEPVYIGLGYMGSQVQQYVENLGLNFEACFKSLETDFLLQYMRSLFSEVRKPFLLMFGDEILIQHHLPEMISTYLTGKVDGLMGFVPEQNREEIKKTYSIETNEFGNIFRLVEKPKNPPNNTYKGTGNCILPPQFFDWIDKVQTYEVQDFVSCVQYGIEQGFIFRPFQVCQKYFNINTSKEYTELLSRDVAF